MDDSLVSRRFLITGLPRSRTAWLAVATTTINSICHHEPTSRTSSFEELVSIWKPSLGISVGVSDSALALFVPRILNTLSPHTLIVDRPMDECLASFEEYMKRLGLKYDMDAVFERAKLFRAALAPCHLHPKVKVIKYHELSDYDVVKDALRWVLPDSDFSDLKFLLGLNIQVDRSHLAESLAREHNGWHLKP